jgi:hypothetical protein
MKIKAKFKFKVHKKSKKDLTWEEAKAYCKSLGDGWRLPNRVELLLMYENREEIGGFKSECYWSSTEYTSNYAWYSNFNFGYSTSTYKSNTCRVRAVRDC